MRDNMGLYRGKRKDTGEWVEGSFFFGFGKTYICPEAIAMYYYDGALCLGGFVEVDLETVGQFTGIYDSTKWEDLTPEEQQAFLHQPDGWVNTPGSWIGKQIFDGDIIRFNYDETVHTGVVRFGIYKDFHVGFHIKWISSDADGLFRQDLRFWTACREITVIGNIHDNPELLEVK